MSLRPTVTVAMIVYNEQRHLRELLPLLEWADEVVVVDGGSSDATVSIAQSHGCRVISRPFDTFANQRNHALRLAASDWVFSIDADERPTPALLDELRRRIARTLSVETRCAAFRIPIRSTIFGSRLRRCGTQDDRPVRLFRRDKARWIGGVHEVLHVDGQTGTFDHWLTHETHADLETFLIKMHRYTRLEAQSRVAAGKLPRPSDAWFRPCREVFRRLIYKQGIFDGPTGWAFCLLSGLSEWVLAREHRRQYELQH